MSGGLARVSHMVIAIDLDQADLAELALAHDPVAGLDQVGRAAALGADLHDPLCLRAAASMAWPSLTSTLIGF